MTLCDSPLVKTTVDLPANLLRQARVVAASRGQNLQEIISDALRHILPRPMPKPGKSAPKRRKKTLPPLAPDARGWLRDWENWSREISVKTKSSESAAELISKMRR